MDYRTEAPEIIKSFLIYHETIKGHSPKTVEEYYLDLRTFFRYMKISRGLVPRDTELEDISISDIDLEFVRSITVSDAYEYLAYLSRDRVKNQRSRETEYGTMASTRARKVSTLRSFYKYLTVKAKLLDVNPLQDLDVPKIPKKLPRYLTLPEAQALLSSVDGKNKERDYAILTIFLNCGLRLSELVGLNVTDVRSNNTVRVLGKGNKERIIYLNDACVDAINNYLKVRPMDGVKDKKALFISSQKKRMSPKTVQAMVYKYLEKIGLDSQGYSCHKLRHTAATLMYQHGNVDIRVLKEVLGHENLGTTEIYTHHSNKQLEEASKSNPLAKVKQKKDKK